MGVSSDTSSNTWMMYTDVRQAGWVNELLARLTDSEVVDSTTTNRTLDADEASFPRGGKHFFVVGSATALLSTSLLQLTIGRTSHMTTR